MSDTTSDIAIVGGGILGMATALELSRRLPRHRVLVLEKERALAAHQTGNNSGVIHSGIYYRPGSLKARNCVAGARALLEFCQENDVGYKLCGKVIVATEERELPALNELHRRGTANGVPGLEMVGSERLRELEPHTRGVQALWSPNTGIVDYRQVTEAYARRFQENGGQVWTDARVLRIRSTKDGHVLTTRRGDVQARYLINCAGLYADAVARMVGVRLPIRIIPFRGEYYFLAPEAQSLVRGLIYPVPDPRFPFLGVHFTRTVHGQVEAGPNAVLAFAREGYSMGRVRPGELWGTLAYRGFWAMSRRHWRTGLMEVRRSLSKAAFTRSLQRLVPEVESRQLVRGGAGVRAQAVDRSGALVDDFRISETQNAIHVLNAPSPGATASLAIAQGIVDMAANSFELSA